ncbi:MAG TPA: DmsC/YnfH family molybdoenzyme membrane anchor subunit [Desulfuromonadaceae bacterium]|nr:DmsC/YnfH family molybdoenzyme membrane anchor subunit [Desulfuromonadaceae bacterium]
MNLEHNNGQADGGVTTLIDELLAGQRALTAVERFSQHHDHAGHSPREKTYRALLPARSPNPGEQYAFQVDLDACSGCKACVAGCHSLNGLDEHETWREVGLLISSPGPETRNAGPSVHQTVTTACHHCVDPGCLSGCPVKAYDKDPTTGIVRHLDDQCIGCQYCVMKCPYEVPKYSESLGIVRKCDMCVNRLGAGEAPACVQSCPNGAITITIVNQRETVEALERSSATASGVTVQPSHDSTTSWLADAPDPAITHPTTRYLSKRSSTGLVAADHGVPRLDPSHWPLIVMLVFTQASAGLLLAALVVRSAPVLYLTAFTLLNIGLMAAPLHLGQPLKAWRAFLGWRTSWLSREIIAFNMLAPLAAMATVLAWLPILTHRFPKLSGLLEKVPAWMPLDKLQFPIAASAALVGIGCVLISAMVYVDTRRPFWSPRHSFGAFMGTSLLLGSTFAAATVACLGKMEFARDFAITALVVRSVLFAWRRLEIHFAFNNAHSPIHLNARAIRELLSWTPSLRLGLFTASTVFGLMAIGNVGNATAIWAGIAAMTTLTSEIVVRYVFFRAGAGKKMPGGIIA